jgi:hypothetical protein
MLELELALGILRGLCDVIPVGEYDALLGHIKAANRTVKIYRIVCNITGRVYVGFTKMSLAQRLSLHKSSYKRGVEGKSKDNMKSGEIIKDGDYRIEIIEMCSEREKEDREVYHIENSENCVNVRIPIKTYEDYLENKIEARTRTKTEFDKYREKYTCECGKTISNKGRRKHEGSRRHKHALEQKKLRENM